MSCIAIDSRLINFPVGIGTYTRGVLPNLLEKLSQHHCVLFAPQSGIPFAVPGNTSVVEISAKHYSLGEHLEIPRRLKQVGADLLYSPHFTVPLQCPVAFVATVHDLILHKYPNSASALKQWAYKVAMKNAVSNASRVIAVSEFTATEVRSEYGVEPIVVTEGVDPLFRKKDESEYRDVLKKYGLEEGFFLYVGGAKEHKNVQMLIDAHATVSDPAPLVLVCSGAEADGLELSNQSILLKNVDTADLPSLYSAAKCFVTASLAEGFCLPILEARACGCPVIASNTTAIPEVCPKEAVLTEPTIESIAQAITNPPTTVSPPESVYNWEHSAEDIANILTKALSDG